MSERPERRPDPRGSRALEPELARYAAFLRAVNVPGHGRVLVERAFGGTATSRNWSTVTRLASLG
ncbi:MAG TPA: hypothetical protein VFV10_07465 [Gammaproteobacteria bacterium]|nr:hypothetical protein [Gammaproteobacteria bacterium]